MITTVLGFVSLGLGGLLMLWQFLAPPACGNSWTAYLALFSLGVAGRHNDVGMQPPARGKPLA
jgi:hypothetical protein